MARRFVSFMLGGTRYGVPVAEVAQVIRHEHVQPAPSAPPGVEGIVTLGGEVVPVLDLHVMLPAASAAAQRPEARPRANRRRILVVRLGGRTCGIAVDEVHELVDIDESAILPVGAADAASGSDDQAPLLPVTATARFGATIVYLPDLAALLDPGRYSGPTEGPVA